MVFLEARHVGQVRIVGASSPSRIRMLVSWSQRTRMSKGNPLPVSRMQELSVGPRIENTTDTLLSVLADATVSAMKNSTSDPFNGENEEKTRLINSKSQITYSF